MKESDLKPYSLFSHIQQIGTFPKYKRFDEEKEFQTMREQSPGPQAYSIDVNYVSNPTGKPATFPKQRKDYKEEDVTPGPSDYELRPHILS